uniref:Uncharacterized protein n=1 Tax=Meloidogyne floridensis TaxID=298350 RepID=A0A915NJP0_9BILA
MISDATYIEMLKNCSKWNSRVMSGRTRSQTAVYDQQTGVMHRPTEHLFRTASERCRSRNPMQVYVYTPHRWVRPKTTPSAAVETNYFLKNNPTLRDVLNSKDPTQLSLLSNADSTSNDQAQQLYTNMSVRSNMSYMGGNGGTKIYDNDVDLNDYDLDEPELNEQSDEDDWGSNKPKQRKRGGGAVVGGRPLLGRPPKRLANANVGGSGGSTPNVMRIARNGEQVDSPGYMGSSGTNEDGRSVAAPPPDIRPFVCQFCGAKYKSRPGLTYHRAHTHQAEIAATKNDVPPSPMISSKVHVSDYCDFCLGDLTKNAAGKAEELVSCHDCGRSGHPTCLKFTKNMLISTKRYGWQCIECKACSICGTSENDHQLLFCDDCDRGFHLYCLKPPLQVPPETDWSCHLCIQAFGANASINKSH